MLWIQRHTLIIDMTLRLRPRQKKLVELSLKALEEHGNTLAVAPTGAGKAIMLSVIAGERIQKTKGKVCILAHRDELTTQNAAKFTLMNPTISTSIFNAKEKSWDGQAIVAMAQTLSRLRNLHTMPPLDTLLIDEAHHVMAPTYLSIITHAREKNPNLKLIGFTATPNRGDKKGLGKVFSNVADQIRLSELIAAGHLVRPRTLIMNVGTQDKLKAVACVADDFDMGAVEKIMNTAPINAALIREWRNYAQGCKTVIFCATVRHATHVMQAFRENGIAAVIVHGDLSTVERQEALAQFEQGDVPVIVNVAVLTEGWDYQPTGCVMLLRPSSYKSTMIQMIGRGLRTVDPALFPDVTKTDCIVLDFGISTMIHGSLEQEIDLDSEAQENPSEEEDIKACAECLAPIPARSAVYALCGSCQPVKKKHKTPLEDFDMREIQLLQQSLFRWVGLFSNTVHMAIGFSAWSGIFYYADDWYAVGCKDRQLFLLHTGERHDSLHSAEQWLETHETNTKTHKDARWLDDTVSEAQLTTLESLNWQTLPETRYHASALINCLRYQTQLKQLIGNPKSQPSTLEVPSCH